MYTYIKFKKKSKTKADDRPLFRAAYSGMQRFPTLGDDRRKATAKRKSKTHVVLIFMIIVPGLFLTTFSYGKSVYQLTNANFNIWSAF